MHTSVPQKISVIIPVYQAEACLTDCLDSVLRQSLSDFELLLIDDGSTDQSGTICDRYAQKDSRISVYHCKNQGVGSARNLGICKARGDYLLFVDADDLIAPDCLEKLWLALPQGCNSAISLCHFQLLTDGVLTDRPEELPSYRRGQDSLYELYLQPLVLGIMQGSSCRTLYPTALLKKHGIRFSSCKIAEDQLFLMEVLSHCEQAAICPEVLYIYRQDRNSSSHRIYIRDYLPHRLEYLQELNRILSGCSLQTEQYTWLMAYAFAFCRMLLYMNATASPASRQEIAAIDQSIFGTRHLSRSLERRFRSHLKKKHRMLNFLVNRRCFRVIRWLRSRKHTG